MSQQHEQQTSKRAAVPTAPYPPMNTNRRYPPAQISKIRSSLSSSPQYTTAYTTSSQAVSSTTSRMKDSVGTTMNAPGSSSSERGDESATRMDAGVSGRPTTFAGTSSTASSNASRNLWSRVNFCSSNIVACINCMDSTSSNQRIDGVERSSKFRSTGSTPTKSNRRLGPVLLELRRLELIAEQQSEKTGIFSTRTIALSRGNPLFGTSVSSTCLDVALHSSQTYSDSVGLPPPCATGLTTGALCIHTFQKQDYDEKGLDYSGSIDYFHTPRHHRQAMAVSWRPRISSHVAVGLIGSSSSGSAGGSIIGPQGHVVPTGPSARSVNNSMGSGGVSLRTATHGGTGGDREFCCFLWDVEHQNSSKRTASTGVSPLFKFSHNQGVASLAWVMDGQTLAVGGQFRNIQLYDMRVSGTSSATPPISAFAHNFGVHGIQMDPHRPHQFATFCRSIGEPVKVWDVRRMESVVSEIKINHGGTNLESSKVGQQSPTVRIPMANAAGNAISGASCGWVTSIQWSNLEPGILSVSIGDTVHDYDTLSSVSRPILLRVNRARAGGPILDMALFRGSHQQQAQNHSANTRHTSSTQLQSKKNHSPSPESRFHNALETKLISELYTRRMLVVLGDRNIHDMAKHTIAPVTISRRDGRVVRALGRSIWMGSSHEGECAMENVHISPNEDISATMMRRARCQHTARYSTDTASNIKMLVGEMHSKGPASSRRDALLRLWSWIERMEELSGGVDNDVLDEYPSWPYRGLTDAGVWHILQMDANIENEESSFSESLSCNTYEGSDRSAALTACGWAGKYDLSIVLAECEALGEFERSAALAVWHGDIGAAVDALRRGAEAIEANIAEKSYGDSLPITNTPLYKYAETLQLVAMCIAGYGGFNSQTSAFQVWRKACTNLMQRPELSDNNSISSRTAYLRALCKFLVNIAITCGHDAILNDNSLSLCDRVAFACRFLPRADLKVYLSRCVQSCQLNGSIEGIVITGIEKEGVKIIQSYVDRTADVQTAALVSSRVIFPTNWTIERKICSEWLHCYRTLLNSWQMWQSRAMFDVDRADLLRRIKIRNSDANALNASGKGANYAQHRRMQGGRRFKQIPDPDIMPSVPAQLDARCVYCSSPLGLKRRDNYSNQWLSKMKPVLSCCPQCRKPLPRCSICLLSLGCLNPYMELTRERARSSARGPIALQAPDDLSSLANLPFAEWFTWCMRCKHGGHAHHLVGWFASHDVCPVSGCNCQCQFDGVQKLNRPALSKTQALNSNIQG